MKIHCLIKIKSCGGTEIYDHGMNYGLYLHLLNTARDIITNWALRTHCQ